MKISRFELDIGELFWHGFYLSQFSKILKNQCYEND